MAAHQKVDRLQLVAVRQWLSQLFVVPAGIWRGDVDGQGVLQELEGKLLVFDG